VGHLRLIFGEDYWYPKSVDQLYRPLTTLSFLLNYTVLGNGDAPVGYHWVNIGLHVVNVVLVYFLMLRIVGGRALAASIAAVFAVHPVTVARDGDRARVRRRCTDLRHLWCTPELYGGVDERGQSLSECDVWKG